VEWKIIDRNPAAAKFRAAKRKRVVCSGGPKIRFFDPNEARKFLEVAKDDQHEALYALDITTGLRPEGLYGLRWKDLDLDNHRLTINQVVSKTRRNKGMSRAMNSGRPRRTRAAAQSTIRRLSRTCFRARENS
jgi:integrase